MTDGDVISVTYNQDVMTMDKLEELEHRIDVLTCDGNADSMFELANIVKALIQEIRQSK